MDHLRLPIEIALLRSALLLILLAGFAIRLVSPAFAQDQQYVWSGQAQCQLTVQSPTYTYQEIQTWTIAGAPNANGSMVYPATWSVVGQGQRQDTQGTQATAAQWTTNVPPMSASLAIFVNSAHQLIIKPYHAQLRADGAVTGSRQLIISGVAQNPTTISFVEFEWQFPRIEVAAMKSDVKGTSSDPITSSIGPMQPARLPGVANCQWQFSKGAAVLPRAAIPAIQAATQAGISPAVNTVDTTAAVTSLAAASSRTAMLVDRRATAQPGNLSEVAEAKATATAVSPGSTSSSTCQAVDRPQDPMVMGTFHAGKSLLHSGTLTSATDSHFFQFRLPAGVDADITLTGMQPGSDFDLYVYHSDFSPISCSLTRRANSKNIKTQFGNSQSSNVVIVEVRSYTWNATSPAYTLAFKGVAGGIASP